LSKTGYSFFIARRYLSAKRALSSKKKAASNDTAQSEKSEFRFVSVIVAIATGGVGLGVAALIVTLAILSGFEKTLTDNIVGFTSHAEISGYGNRALPDYPGTSRYLLAKIPAIKTLSPYVEQQAIIRSPHGLAGVVLKGVLPEDTTPIARRRITSGSDFGVTSTDSFPPIIISKGLAQELKTGVGKSVAAMRFHEQMRTREDILANVRKFRVVGIFETGMSEYDNTLAYTTLAAAQSFSNYSPTQVNGYEVMTTSLDSARSVTAKINHTLHYPYFAQSVYDVHQPIFAWIELQKKPIPIILGLIIIVAAFNVVSTLLLIVIEKTHSVGVLKSLGASNRGIAQIFLTEGAAIGIMGTILGDLLGFGICLTESHFHLFKLRAEIYFMSSVPISIEWQHYVIVSVISLVLALLATIIPARIAARLRPLEALQFG
jgi:lipoprotein-releasing system permease protein